MRSSSFNIGDNNFSSFGRSFEKAKRTNKIGGLITFILWVFFLTCWFINMYKLTKCDFDAPYKCEVIHAIGLFPLASPVTMFYPTVDEKVVKY